MFSLNEKKDILKSLGYVIADVATYSPCSSRHSEDGFTDEHTIIAHKVHDKEWLDKVLKNPLSWDVDYNFGIERVFEAEMKSRLAQLLFNFDL